MNRKLIWLLAALMAVPPAATAQSPSGITGGGRQQPGRPAPRLKPRTTHIPRTPAVPQPARAADFSACVLRALEQMPRGGGYSVKASASRNLSTKAVVWDETAQRLRIDVQAAQPSFCSGACYVALLHALEIWQASSGAALPPAAWKAMDVHGQADGSGVWGRANANGPGFSKLVHDLNAGVSFTDPAAAQPGDFLKFFWSGEIGARERGHMVVFLGTQQVEGQPHIRYWSANMPDGYSERSIPLSKMHHLIFTRITRPANFANAATLPATDTWLRDMQKKSVDFSEVSHACGIGSPVQGPAQAPGANATIPSTYSNAK